MEDKKGFFSNIEEKVIESWKKNDIFAKSIENRPEYTEGKNNEYVFFDGPPFANGLPHYGHLLTGFIKDVFARYKTIKGKKVQRKFGWDCHGLPAEMEAEKNLGISGKKAIIEYGVENFNKECHGSVLKYTNEWKDYVNRQARWVDIDNPYKTLDKEYMESTIWAFKELYKKGLVYQDFRVLPYSWKCQTPLSNFETRLDNSYRKIRSKSLYVKFQLKSPPAILTQKFGTECKYFIVVWTTTPWTLPSNLAVAIKKDATYTAWQDKDKNVLITIKSKSHELLDGDK